MKSEQHTIQKSLIDIAMALTSEKNYNRLLDKIVTEAMGITKADGGTLYLLQGDYLHHRIMHTKSMGFSQGMGGETFNIAPLILGKDHVATYAALEKSTVKIDDVYHSELFDFSGPKEFDEKVGYKTTSMLVCPMISRNNKVVGVLQLINALDPSKKPIPFNNKYTSVIESIASLAGISIENMHYIEEIRDLFESFVKVIAKTIDERTPYNKLHSENLSIRIEAFARYLNTVDHGVMKKVYFSETHIHKLVTAAWLHDIGKIVVPLETLDKPDRLDFRYKHLMDRYDLIQTKLERNFYKVLCEKGPNQKFENAFNEALSQLNDIRRFITETNKSSTYVDDAIKIELDRLLTYHFDGVKEPILTEEEHEHLCIAQGTLTTSEKRMVQEHMPAGERILSELTFPEYLEGIFDWIIKHHEYLDGTGYPHGCIDDEISIESRMLTMLDIFDSLVQSDRPYKKAMAPEKALSIIESMASEGKLDTTIVQAYKDSHLWKNKL